MWPGPTPMHVERSVQESSSPLRGGGPEPISSPAISDVKRQQRKDEVMSSSGREARRNIVSEKKRQREEMERQQKAYAQAQEAEKARKRRIKFEQQKEDQKKVRIEHADAKWKLEQVKKEQKHQKDEIKKLQKKIEEYKNQIEKVTPHPNIHIMEENNNDLAQPLIQVDGHGILPFPSKYMHWGVLVWECANSLSETLNLAPFSLDHFAHAIHANCDSILMIETARNLLNLALSDNDIQVLDQAQVKEESAADSDDSDESSYSGDETYTDDSDEDYGKTTRGGKTKKRRLRKNSSPKSKGKASSHDKVNPRNWESMLARSLGNICVKLFSNQEDDDDDDGFGFLAAQAAVAQAYMLGLPTDANQSDDDDDDDDDDEEEEEDNDLDTEKKSTGRSSTKKGKKKSARKKIRFRDLEPQYKLAALAVVALGAYGTSKANSIYEQRKSESIQVGKDHIEIIKGERKKIKDQNDAIKEELLIELREEKKLLEFSNAQESTKGEKKSSSAASADAQSSKNKASSSDVETNNKKEKEPSANEINRRLELRKDAIILEDRTIIAKAPPLDDGILEDESTLENRINSASFEDESRIRQAELRKELDGIKKRNQEIYHLRASNKKILQERKEVLAELSQIMDDVNNPFCHKSSITLLSSLRALIKRAKKNALLIGEEGDCNQSVSWCTKEMADALRLFAKIEKRAELERHEIALRNKLAKINCRREPLGRDRKGRLYWWFDDLTLPGHAVPKLPRIFRQTFIPTDNNLEPQDDDDYDENNQWVVFASKKDLAELAAALADSHSFERELKSRIYETFDLEEHIHHAKRTPVAHPPKYDDDIEMHDASQENNPDAEVVWERTGNDFLGSFVLRKFNRSHAEGLVVGWLPPTDKDPALWHIEHSDGDEEDLEESELQIALADHANAFKKYVNVRTRGAAKNFITDYFSISGTLIPTVKRGLSDYGYSSTQIKDYLNNIDD